MSTARLFVYGSLKRGFRHHDELAEAEFLAAAITAPGYRLVRYGEYPALVRRPASPAGAADREEPGGSQPDDRPDGRPDESGVHGELYLVPLAALPRLDEFEECPTLYQRETVELSDGTQALAYVITQNQAAAHEVIVDGCWREDGAIQRSEMGL